MNDWAPFNKIYLTYFKVDRLPSRSAFGTAGLALNAASNSNAGHRRGRRSQRVFALAHSIVSVA